MPPTKTLIISPDSPPPSHRIVEIARSFSYKLNIGNYQSCDAFCSQKAECREDEADEVSERIHAFCKSQVMKAIAEARKEARL